MSVKELILGESPIKIKVTKFKDKLDINLFDTKSIAGVILDRGQAQLLYMYLQEHLK